MKASAEQSRPIGHLAGLLGYITEAELQQLADVTEGTAEAWRKRGTGPAFVRFGRNYLYPQAAVAEFLNRRVRQRHGYGAEDRL